MKRDERRRERRVFLSLLSLLLLGTLLGGWIVLRASNQGEGKLGSISTAQVKVSINEASQPEPPLPANEGVPSPTPATAVKKPPAGQGPSLTAEVLGASTGAAGGDDAALAVSAPAGRSQTGAPALSTSTATTSQGTPTPTQRFVGPTPPERPDPTSTPGNSWTLKTPTAVASDPEALPIGGHSHLSIPGIIAPGTYKSGGIVVTNVGTVTFHYSVSLSLTGDAGFGGQLKLRIYLRQTGLTTCNYQAGIENFVALVGGDETNRVLYNGTFSAGNLIGNPSVEIGAGDRVLTPAQSEVLCMELIFPASATNAAQGKTVTGTFEFTAKSPE